eukprot:scaffold26513_cov107-Isochrysis_galbana.AAC.2
MAPRHPACIQYLTERDTANIQGQQGGRGSGCAKRLLALYNRCRRAATSLGEAGGQGQGYGLGAVRRMALAGCGAVRQLPVLPALEC